MSEHDVALTVNGTSRRGHVEARTTLADFLREGLGLTGTHLACEHGVCGACTVMFDGRAVRSCLMFAVQADGADVTTVEGLSGPNGELSTVQQAFMDAHGLQCGFCTPGFVVSVTAFLARPPVARRRRDPRGARRQPLPLHRLPGHHRGREARRRAAVNLV